MTSNEIKKNEGRWARKRRLKREQGQRTQQKEKKKVVESYRKTARLRLQEMFNEGVRTKRSSDKMNADTQNKIYSQNTLKRTNANLGTLLIGSQKPIKRPTRSLTLVSM